MQPGNCSLLCDIVIDLQIKEVIPTLVGELLAKGKTVRLRMARVSMTPTIKINDYIIVKKIPLSQLRIGSIILYQNENFFYTHRFLYKKEKLLRTKGDRLHYIDPSISQKQFLGKVIAIEKNGKIINLETLRYCILNLWKGLLSLGDAILYKYQKSNIKMQKSK